MEGYNFMENKTMNITDDLSLESLNKIKFESNEQLAEFISGYLPISYEDTLSFVIGAINGGISDKIDFVMALGLRDRTIKELKKEIKMLKEKLYGVKR